MRIFTSIVLTSALLAAATVGAATASAAGSGHAGIAAQLLKRDPGARLGGKTIVGTKDGQRLVGKPGKPNFIVALGDDSTIVGARPDDELGAIGKHVKIIAPSKGHALIEAGPGGKVIVSGAGHDLVYDPKPNTTIVLKSPGNNVIASGAHDHIKCSGRFANEEIQIGKADTVDPSCRSHHDQVLPLAGSAIAASGPLAHAAQTGQGTNENPFVAPCSSAGETCIVYFAWRELRGYWANESVPAYRCPSNYPWLLDKNYAPAGTTVPPGVEVHGLGPIGVSITAHLSESFTHPSDWLSTLYAVGTATGPGKSSATNWTFENRSYRVILHCASRPGTRG